MTAVQVIHVPITQVPQPGAWGRKARCRTAPTSVFFPTQGDDVGQAKAICRGCPVLAECRTYALTYPSLQGVWAAMSEQERERIVGRMPASAEEQGLFPCGTAAAYKRHLRHGEPPCAPCTEANRLRQQMPERRSV